MSYQFYNNNNGSDKEGEDSPISNLSGKMDAMHVDKDPMKEDNNNSKALSPDFLWTRHFPSITSSKSSPSAQRCLFGRPSDDDRSNSSMTNQNTTSTSSFSLASRLKELRRTKSNLETLPRVRKNEEDELDNHNANKRLCAKEYAGSSSPTSKKSTSPRASSPKKVPEARSPAKTTDVMQSSPSSPVYHFTDVFTPIPRNSATRRRRKTASPSILRKSSLSQSR
jgi:hypothetical protein